MATLGDLYREADALQKQYEGMTRTKERGIAITHLKRMKEGLLNAYQQAGGSKAPMNEVQEPACGGHTVCPWPRTDRHCKAQQGNNRASTVNARPLQYSGTNEV